MAGCRSHAGDSERGPRTGEPQPWHSKAYVPDGDRWLKSVGNG